MVGNHYDATSAAAARKAVAARRAAVAATAAARAVGARTSTRRCPARARTVIQPSQPTLPPGAPQPAPGPGLVAGASADAADLAVTQRVTPPRTVVGGSSCRSRRSATSGRAPPTRSSCARSRRPTRRTPTASSSSCRSTRGPSGARAGGRCPASSARWRPGRGSRSSRAADAPGRVLQVGRDGLQPDAGEQPHQQHRGRRRGRPRRRAAAARERPVAATSCTRATGSRYRVAVHAPRQGVDAVRLCHRPARGLLVMSAPGTQRAGGRLCIDISHLKSGATRSFTVHAVASAQYAGRRVLLPAAADSPERARAVRRGRGHRDRRRGAERAGLGSPARAAPTTTSTPTSPSASPRAPTATGCSRATRCGRASPHRRSAAPRTWP